MAMEEVVEVQHESHDHPLMLIKPEETHKDWDLTCYGCEQPISASSSHYYGCKRCVFLLHKTCAQPPPQMTHPSHPLHPLTFRPIPAYRGDKCVICREECKRFTYRCPLCWYGYNIDMKCALVVLSIQRSIKHTSHPHQLIPLQKESMFFCDACGEEHKGTSFLCTTCGFWINQKCASSPLNLNLSNHHPHTLSLGYFTPQEKYIEYYCRICSKSIYRRNWLYSCSQCDYNAHLRCAVNGTEATELDSSNLVTASSDKVPIKSQELDPTVIHLPKRDDSFDIITQFIKNTSEQGKYKEATEIKHICHDHPLTYVDFEKPIDQAASRSMSDVSSLLGGERNAGKCGGCAQSISAPFYHCVECNFSLHVWCAELPEKLQHPGHSEHTLSLTMAKYYVECVGCHLFQNTMHYVCGECAFYLDCKCASLPRIVKHEEHKHNLALRPTSISKCISCGVTSSGISFECGGCQHYLCTRCVFFPRTVRHRYDKLHPFILNYSRLSYQTDDDFCEICEEEINSNHWFYHCGECNQYLHKDCVFPLTSKKPYRLRGFVSRNQQHQHRLARVELYEDLSCSLCERNVLSRWAFLCPLCKFCLCSGCFWRNNKRETEELDPSNSDKVPIKSQELDPTVIYLPRRDDSFDIITQSIKNTSEQGKYKEATEIKHICHDHPLTYVDFEKPIDQAASRSMSDVSSLLSGERKAGKCDGCAQSISAPFYHCVECNFSLHVWCAELPEKLQHPGHSEHTLSLTMAKYYVECDGCHLFQNIMHYVCWECAFFLDCKCASLPRVVKHEEHRHNLALRPTSISKCISCGVTSSGISFECGGCQHYLCTRCVFFPRTVRHKYDRLHPFILNYSRLSYQIDDEFCEICEEEINSNHWFYHCGECDQYLHKDCVFPLTSKKPYRLVDWFPSRTHQHLLAAVELYEDLSCSLCERNVHGYSSGAYLCPLCKFCLCYDCFWKYY